MGSDSSSMHDAQWDEGRTSIQLWNFSFSWQVPLGKLKKIEFHKNASELLFLEFFLEVATFLHRSKIVA